MTATIVVVEDEAIIAMSLQDMLEEFGYRVPTVAATAAEALAAVAAHQPDLLLLDIHLAGGDDGIALAEELRARHDLPVVFLTAHSDASTVARAKAAQPAQFLLKPFNEREVQIAIDLALTRSAGERRLRASEQRFATTLHSIAEGVIVTDADRCVAYLNPAAARLTGWPQPEALGRPLDEVAPVEAEGHPLSVFVERAISQGAPLPLPDPAVLTRRDGARRDLADSIAPLVDERGRAGGAVLVLQDVTEKRQAAAERQLLERQLLETQRLESLGLLAGGVAHDFNNLLTFILGYVELAQAEVAPESDAGHYLRQVLSGGRRAVSLVRQLLAYAGKERFNRQELELNQLLLEMQELLHASIGRRVPITFALSPTCLRVEADPTQLHQVVLNLLTNAAEAMEGGDGSITVRTGQRALSAAALERCLIGADLAPGRYTYIQVRDTGVGMDRETLARIFDPFFTTKFTGRGLGLAAVQGILRAHHAALEVASAPGDGSTFSVYLPALSAHHGAGGPEAPPAPGGELRAAPGARQGSVLVIDDEEGVRSMLARMLAHMGYRVLSAADGPSGLELLRGAGADLRAILLDLTMPGMSGREAAQQAQALRPGTPVILMSGYSAEEVAPAYAEQGPQRFLAKPFTLSQLVAALESALAAG